MVDPLQKLDKLKRFYQADDIIIGEGETNSDFFILLSGHADVYIGERKVAEISGDEGAAFFGELASIMEEPRSASVVAVDKCAVLCIPANSLTKVLALSPSLLTKLLRQLASRIKNLNQHEEELDHDLNEAQEFLELKIMKTKNHLKGVVALLEVIATQTDDETLRGLAGYVKEANPLSVRSGSTSHLDMNIIRKMSLDKYF